MFKVYPYYKNMGNQFSEIGGDKNGITIIDRISDSENSNLDDPSSVSIPATGIELFDDDTITLSFDDNFIKNAKVTNKLQKSPIKNNLEDIQQKINKIKELMILKEQDREYIPYFYTKDNITIGNKTIQNKNIISINIVLTKTDNNILLLFPFGNNKVELDYDNVIFVISNKDGIGNAIAEISLENNITCFKFNKFTIKNNEIGLMQLTLPTTFSC